MQLVIADSRTMLSECLGSAVLGAFVSLLVFFKIGHKFLHWPALDDKDAIKLGDPAYKIKTIVAPVASGNLIRILARILGGTGLLADLLRRMLLNDNKISRLRCLAGEVIKAKSFAMTFYPLHRLEASQLAEHTRLAEAATGPVNRPNKYNSVLDYHEAYKSKMTTPVKVLEAAFSAIDELPPERRIFTPIGMVQRDALMAEAEAASARYQKGQPLSAFDGVPVAVKDMVPMAGLNCTYGTHPSWGTGTDAKDDVIITTLRSKGAIVLGLTVMTEFGSTPLGYSVHSHSPVNPYNGDCYSGGSSSGSGLGAALGIFPVALGFDGGGSIRIPSAMQGIVGLKATFGRIAVDDDPCAANVSSGPMAGSAADVALFYLAVAQPVPGHFYSSLHGASPLPAPHCYGFNNVDDLSDIRIGIFEDWFNDCDQEVLARSHDALDYLKSKGATVVPVRIPHLEVLHLAHGINISCAFSMDHENQYFKSPETLEPATVIQMGIGGAVSGNEYISTAWIRGWAMSYLQELFTTNKLSGILTPTLACLPPKLPAAAKETGLSDTALVMQMTKYIFIANFCGLPSISIPAGLSKPTKTEPAMPIGVTFTAPHWDEHTCLRLANALDEPRFRSVPPGFVDLLQGITSSK